MGLLNIYDTISSEHKAVRATGRIRDILPEYDFSHTVCIKAGERVPPEYSVQDDDVLYVRVLPSEPVTFFTCVLTLMAVAGAYTINQELGTIQQDALDQAKEAQRQAAEKAQQVTNLPFLQGASNTSALGQNIQYQLGEMYNTPYLLTDGWYSIEGQTGEKQYYNAVLCSGYGPQLLKSMSIGTQLVKEWNSQSPQSGVYSFDEGIYYDEHNLIEITQGGSFVTPGFGNKVQGTKYGDEIVHDYGKESVPLIKQLAKCTKKMEFCIQFNGLRQYTDGAWARRKVWIKADWSNDGGETWNALHFASEQEYDAEKGSAFEYNSNHTLRFACSKEFTALEAYDKDILLRLERTNPCLENSSQESAYLLYVNCWAYDAAASTDEELADCEVLESPWKERTCRIALRMIANENTSDQLNAINFISASVARTWNGTAWSVQKTATRNPAAWILEVLTSYVHPHSKYEDSEIDLASLGRLYEYCEENEYYCDGLVTDSVSKKDLLQRILTLCGATLIINTSGLLEAVIDKKETLPVALLNSQCVKSITVNKSFARVPDGIKITFTDRSTWKASTRYIMMDGGQREDTDQVTEQAIDYATTPAHVYKIAQKMLRQQKLQPREITCTVGKEGDEYPLYSTVLLQLLQLRQGLCSAVVHRTKIENGILTEIEISDYIDFESGYAYGAVIQAMTSAGRRLIYAKVSGTGRTRVLHLETEVSESDGILPVYGNILSLGYLNENEEFDRVTNVMKIYGISPAENGWNLTLKDYNDALYETGDIPEYKTNLTTPPRFSRDIPPEYATESDLLDMAANIENGTESGNPDSITNLTAVAGENAIELSWSPLGQGLRNTVQKYTIQYSTDSGTTWQDAGTSKTNSFSFPLDRTTHGYPEWTEFTTWQFRVNVTSIYSKTSTAWTYTDGIDTSSYGTWLLGTPSIEVKTENRTVILTMSAGARTEGRKLYGMTRYKVRVMRPMQPNAYVSVRYWMHDTSTDAYWYLDTNDGSVKNTRIKTDADNWISSTEADYLLAYAKPYDALGDENQNHEYSYSARHSNIAGDTEWHVPDGSRDPFAHHDNYKASSEPQLEADRWVRSDSVYVQTMPLYYTDRSTNELNYVDTQYMFDVCAYNDAGNGPWYSGNNAYSLGNGGRAVTAQCTNLRDIVSANETAKEAYIGSLSAISANLGEIRDGSLASSNLNYWTLSAGSRPTPDGDGNKEFTGAFRVGGDREYLRVVPVVDDTVSPPIVTEYRMEFHVGNFTVTSTESQMNGDLIVQGDADSLERVHIKPDGVYLETKEGSQWVDKVHQTKTGTVTPSLQTNPDTAHGSLVITNTDMQARRANGSDIGLPLPASDAEVWHFDTDFFNQHGTQTLTIGESSATGHVAPHLVGEGDTVSGNDEISLAPALLAIAPYSTVAKSIYGNFSLTKTFPASNNWQIEFWMKYVWNENQTLFSVGNSQQNIALKIISAEPNYNDPLEGEPHYNQATAESEEEPYNTPIVNEIHLVYNSPRGVQTVVIPYTSFTMNEWYHVGVFCDGTKFYVNASRIAVRTVYQFTQEAQFVNDITLSINPTMQLSCIDELMVSPTVMGDLSVFNQNSSDRIPFGTLDKDAKHFVLDVSGSNVWTNLFDNATVINQIKNLIVNNSDIRAFIQTACIGVGAVQGFYGTISDEWWLLCDGRDTTGESDELETHYPALYKYLGNSNVLPDLREVTLKGAGETGRTVGAHVKAGGLAVGEFIDDRVQSHTHSYPVGTYDIGGDTYPELASNSYSGRTTGENSGRKGATTEVKAVGVNFYIKAK